MSKVTIIDHPLIQYKLGKLRDKDTGAKAFRELVREMSMLMGYEVTRDLKMIDTEETAAPDMKTAAFQFPDKDIDHPLIGYEDAVLPFGTQRVDEPGRAGTAFFDGLGLSAGSSCDPLPPCLPSPGTWRKLPVRIKCGAQRDLPQQIRDDQYGSSFCRSSVFFR